jgi:hypothetical protein
MQDQSAPQRRVFGLHVAVVLRRPQSAAVLEDCTSRALQFMKGHDPPNLTLAPPVVNVRHGAPDEGMPRRVSGAIIR